MAGAAPRDIWTLLVVSIEVVIASAVGIIMLYENRRWLLKLSLWLAWRLGCSAGSTSARGITAVSDGLSECGIYK